MKIPKKYSVVAFIGKHKFGDAANLGNIFCNYTHFS
jgi:hypothetical protein